MTTFGDWEPADSADRAAFDADAVARLFRLIILAKAADPFEVTLVEVAAATFELAARLQRERP